MADPLTWTIIGGVSAAASAAVGIGSTIMGTASKTKADKEVAKSQSRQLGYQAMVSDYNAKVARQNRDWELKVGGDEGVRYGMGARARMGAIRTKQGASGIDMRSKSSQDVQTSQELVTDIDQRRIADNAARRAYGYETQAQTAEAQAEIYRRGGNDVLNAGSLNAQASLISGVGSVADKWYQASQSGVFTPKNQAFGASSIRFGNGGADSGGGLT